MTLFQHKLRQFLADERGSVLAEAVVILPMVIWTYLAFFVYWDAFKTTNVAQKATYTLADLISREQAVLPTTYADGMLSLAQYLVNDSTSTKLRVSSIVFKKNSNNGKDENKVEVLWSRSPGNAMTPYNNESVQAIISQIPAASEGDSVIVVETEMQFSPIFDVGMSNREVTNFVVTRPRFMPKLCMQGVEC